MAKRVLVPVDGSEQSEAAVAFVRGEWPDAEIVLLTVINPADAVSDRSAFPTGAEKWYESAREEAHEALSALASTVDGPVEQRVAVGRPAATIVEAAADVDHVVLGSHGRTGLSRVVLGSVAEAVARRSPVPVTIVR
jgi:nucleotide-binding universal stress UspA family protein